MTEKLKELLEASIELELCMSELYFLYAKLFPEDSEFWWKLANEEVNHASLLKSGRIYLERGILPGEIVHENITSLTKSIERIRNLVSEYSQKVPSFKDAYYEALKLESSAGEFHFQVLMTEETDSKIVKIFQDLAGDDKDHNKRISDLLTTKVRASDN